MSKNRNISKVIFAKIILRRLQNLIKLFCDTGYEGIINTIIEKSFFSYMSFN